MSLDNIRRSSSMSSQAESSTQVLVAEIAESLTSVPKNIEERELDVRDLIQMEAKDIRAQLHINWMPYLQAGLISKDDYVFINAFQYAENKDERDKLLNHFKDKAIQSLLDVVQRVRFVKEIQRFLILVDDMLWEDMKRVKLFKPDETNPWRAFLDLLSCTDEFVRNIASRIIVVLMSCRESKPVESDLVFYLDWLKGELRRDNKYLQSVARCLQVLLKVDKYRLPFLKNNGIFKIIRLLSEGIKVQAQYQLVFCLWMTSFNLDAVEKMNRYNTIPVLTNLLENAPSEHAKVPRVVTATFRNLLEKPREEGGRKYNALLMVEYKILKIMEIMKSRRSTLRDPEFMEDIEAVQTILEKYVEKLSSFDEYRIEVLSHRLEWSVVHTRKTFWVENAHRLCENDHELLRILVLLLLEDEQDKAVLCVAAHDLGEFMKHFSSGKKQVIKLGGKDALLRLLKHPNSNVKYHALKSLQILMLSSHDLLSESVIDVRLFDQADSYLRSKSAHKALFGT